MKGRIIVQQAPGLGRVQIQPHAHDPFQQLVKHTSVFTVYPRGTNSVWIMPHESKNAINIVFTCDFCHRSFCGLGHPWPAHSALCRLVVGSYAKHHDLSPSQLWSKMPGRDDAPREVLCTRPHALLFAPPLTRAARSERRFFLPRSLVMM